MHLLAIFPDRATAQFVADGNLDGDDVRLALRMIRATARPLEALITA